MGYMGRSVCQAELKHIILDGGYLLRGEFKLASGIRSPFYLDGTALLFDPDGARLFVQWLLLSIDEMETPSAIGGPAIGAVPVSILAMAMSGFHYNAFTVRKQEKDHGVPGLILGRLQPGSKVAIVEDTVTTGGSVMHAVRAVEALQCSVTGIYCLLDRDEGHLPEFDAYKRIFRPMFRPSDLCGLDHVVHP